MQPFEMQIFRDPPIPGGFFSAIVNFANAVFDCQALFGSAFLDNIYISTMISTAKTQAKCYSVGIIRYFATVESILGWLLLALFMVTWEEP
jgi:hypothetical protein